MHWEQDDDSHLLVGVDEDQEPIELGRVTPDRPGFWHWESSFCMAVGGADSADGAKKALVRELRTSLRVLTINLE